MKTGLWTHVIPQNSPGDVPKAVEAPRCFLMFAILDQNGELSVSKRARNTRAIQWMVESWDAVVTSRHGVYDHYLDHPLNQVERQHGVPRGYTPPDPVVPSTNFMSSAMPVASLYFIPLSSTMDTIETIKAQDYMTTSLRTFLYKKGRNSHLPELWASAHHIGESLKTTVKVGDLNSLNKCEKASEEFGISDLQTPGIQTPRSCDQIFRSEFGIRWVLPCASSVYVYFDCSEVDNCEIGASGPYTRAHECAYFHGPRSFQAHCVRLGSWRGWDLGHPRPGESLFENVHVQSAPRFSLVFLHSQMACEERDKVHPATRFPDKPPNAAHMTRPPRYTNPHRCFRRLTAAWVHLVLLLQLVSFRDVSYVFSAMPNCPPHDPAALPMTLLLARRSVALADARSLLGIAAMFFGRGNEGP
ncbi:hypothetical protein P691DRAFT_789750 [Macrolepiota fuliginosa MF-IS2]|uniref:Uncharacterized protein n=1 Tax=Macrolepiota fuliginosa MF-IS2 TaxID=1400762 RepID=A0A9P5X1J5_9AGAR|nr:hypothetical protein P691DRAFT_789750 [Macrolepiota fuliginosa MF-IS2]